jgi:hypothetical protein
MMHQFSIGSEECTSSFLYFDVFVSDPGGIPQWCYCYEDLGGRTSETGKDGINLDAVTRHCGVTVNHIRHTISLQTATSYY